MLPVFTMPQDDSMRNTGMIVENTGNIMLAMIMECRKPRSRKLYRTIA